MVGQLSAESICGCFTSTSRQSSCNYGIGYDGRISLVVEEKNRSWCSSSGANDQRAITIEVASDSQSPYAFKDAAYAALIKLCTDICKRNGKKKLLWLGGKETTAADKAACENYTPASDEMILTTHRFYANKSCPGDWMYARMGDLASKVTSALGGKVSTNLSKGDSGDAVKTMQTMLIACGYSCGSTGADGDFGANTLSALKSFQKKAGLIVDGVYGDASKSALKKAYEKVEATKKTSTASATSSKSSESTASSTTSYYRVRKSWKDAASQIGAFTSLKNAKNCADANSGYAVFDDSGKQVYPEQKAQTTPFRVKVSVSGLRIRNGAGTDTAWTGKYTGVGIFTIVEVLSGSGSKSGWGKLKSGAGYIALDYCEKL